MIAPVTNLVSGRKGSGIETSLEGGEVLAEGRWGE
jgi:hypothetical protein